MSKKILLILLIIIVLGVAGFVFYRGGMFSKEILKLEILAPDTAKIGDEITYTVQYKNNGDFVLQNAKLIFELPDNSLTEDSKTIFTQNLNDIYPGDQESVQFKGRLVGKDGDLKTAKASLTYVPKNITAQYESDTTFITKVDASSVVLGFDLPSQAQQGADFQYTINYSSGVDYPLDNLSVKIDPTPGFDITSAVPKSLDNSEWKLQTLNKDQNGKIVISGKISATASQNLTFSASLGKWQSGDFIVIKQATASVSVVQPSLLITQQVNDSTSYVASPGETLNFKIFFKNIGSTPLDNLSMSAKLDSSALDMSATKAGNGGTVQSNGNTITWDYNKSSQLNHLDSQQQGEIDFSVKTKSVLGALDTDSIINDEINISQTIQNFSVKVNTAGD